MCAKQIVSSQNSMNTWEVSWGCLGLWAAGIVALPPHQPVHFILPLSLHFPGILGASTILAMIYLNGSRGVIYMQNLTQQKLIHDSASQR